LFRYYQEDPLYVYEKITTDDLRTGTRRYSPLDLENPASPPDGGMGRGGLYYHLAKCPYCGENNIFTPGLPDLCRYCEHYWPPDQVGYSAMRFRCRVNKPVEQPQTLIV